MGILCIFVQMISRNQGWLLATPYVPKMLSPTNYPVALRKLTITESKYRLTKNTDMAIQRHPVDSFDKKLNFWEEFPDYKLHRTFGDFWRLNKTAGNLEASSLFMWALSLCYDRKSSLFPQPEQDKWEVVSEDLFGDSEFLLKLAEDPESSEKLKFQVGGTVGTLVDMFEQSIDTPLGISLRLLEAKLLERTQFIKATVYKMDYYETSEQGRVKLVKGTADQLDNMFARTEKINSLIQAAMNSLRSSEGTGSVKGEGRESLGDGDTSF